MPESPPIRRRVHVFPLGFEYARLREPLYRLNADVAVPIKYSEASSTIPYLQSFLEELESDPHISVDQRECDIFDLYDTLGTISRAVADYAEDDVAVNLSAGSKITAIAGMIACMAADARPIYVRPEYGPEDARIPAEPLHDEIDSIFELPRYPIERPSDELIRVMEYIDGETTETGSGRYRGVSKSELIDVVITEEMPFAEESSASTRKGYYRVLDSHVVGPLRDDGYIEVEQVGRTKYVTLSAAGRNVLRAFRDTAVDDG